MKQFFNRRHCSNDTGFNICEIYWSLSWSRFPQDGRILLREAVQLMWTMLDKNTPVIRSMNVKFSSTVWTIGCGVNQLAGPFRSAQSCSVELFLQFCFLIEGPSTLKSCLILFGRFFDLLFWVLLTIPYPFKAFLPALVQWMFVL